MNSEFFREVLFPRRCVPCGTRDVLGAVCDACRGRIVINQTLFCGACRARLPYGKKECHKNFPYLLGAATDYEDPVARQLIHALKFRRCRDAAVPLADALATYISRLPIKLHLFHLLPVPLSGRRERERGFNQSDLVAQEFAARSNLVLAENILVRAKHTKPQSESKDIDERRENLAGAFIASRNTTIPSRILLLDDVTTSGATFLAAATALKVAGARQIIALAVAKA
jgi:ComF family protein